MDFTEAFKMLEIEPTEDKKEIKVAYSKMLKKYHPEEFPEKFMEINEAYEVALKYVRNNYIEHIFQNENYERDFDNFIENDNSFKEILENRFENENIVLENEKNELYYEIFNGIYRIENLSAVIEWVEKFEKLIKNKNHILNDLKKLFEEFNENFSEEDRENIVEIISQKGILNEIISKIFQKKESYVWANNLNGIEIDIILFHFGIIKNHKMNKFKNDRKLKSKIIDEIIEKYFGIKVFRMFNKTFGLYDLESEEKEIITDGEMKFSKILFYCLFFDQREKISGAVKLILDLGIENKIDRNDKVLNFKKIYSVMAVLTILLFYIFLYFKTITTGIYKFGIWIMWISTMMCFMLLDLYFVKIEKNFEWTQKYCNDRIIILETTLCILFTRFRQQSYENIIVFTYLLIILIYIIKIPIISKIRYNKLKKYATEILGGY